MLMNWIIGSSLMGGLTWAVIDYHPLNMVAEIVSRIAVGN